MIAERTSPPRQKPSPELILDRTHLADVRILAGEQFAPLIERFCDNAAAQVEALRAAERSGNIELLRRNAHKLRGSSLVIGAPALAHHAGEVEEKIFRRQLDNLPADIDTIEASYREVAVQLRALIAQLG